MIDDQEATGSSVAESMVFEVVEILVVMIDAERQVRQVIERLSHIRWASRSYLSESCILRRYRNETGISWLRALMADAAVS